MQLFIPLLAFLLLFVSSVDLSIFKRPAFTMKSSSQISAAGQQREKLKFMTYNIDGLNPSALQYRTNTIVALIISEDADIVQLQEVVYETAGPIIRALTANGYTSFHHSDDFTRMCHYFTLTFAKAKNIKDAQISRIPYYGTAASMQGRDLLLLRLTYANLPWLFANCHLESCGTAFKSPGSTIRQAQLNEGLSLLAQHASSGPAILAGDLNIREPEAARVLQSYTGTIVDASGVLEKGRKSNTWFLPGPSAGFSARYDRVYSNCAHGLAPQSIKIIGGDDIYQDSSPQDVCSESELPYRTPSDHRGVVVTYAFRCTEDSSGSSSGGDILSTSQSSQRGGGVSAGSSGSQLRGVSRSAGDESVHNDPSRGKGSVSSINSVGAGAGATFRSDGDEWVHSDPSRGKGSVSFAGAGGATLGSALSENHLSTFTQSSSSSSWKRSAARISKDSATDNATIDLTQGDGNRSKKAVAVEVIVIDSSDDEMCAKSGAGSVSRANRSGTDGADMNNNSISASFDGGKSVSVGAVVKNVACAGEEEEKRRRRELQLRAAERRCAV